MYTIDQIFSKSLSFIIFWYFIKFFSGRLNGTSTQKIRTHHEILTRENEKLARQLYERDRQQQGHSNGKRVILVEEDEPVEEVKNFDIYLNILLFCIRYNRQLIVNVSELIQLNLMKEKCLYQ